MLPLPNCFLFTFSPPFNQDGACESSKTFTDGDMNCPVPHLETVKSSGSTLMPIIPCLQTNAVILPAPDFDASNDVRNLNVLTRRLEQPRGIVYYGTDARELLKESDTHTDADPAPDLGQVQPPQLLHLQTVGNRAEVLLLWMVA